MNIRNRYKKKQILSRKKTNPTDFTYTGERPKNEEIYYELFQYSEEKCLSKQGRNIKNLQLKESEKHTQWVDITGLNRVDEIVTFCQNNGIHRLSIQDILDINQRPKFQMFEDYSLLILQSFQKKDTKWKVSPVSLIFKNNSLISFQDHNSQLFIHIKQRLEEGKGVIRKKRVGFLLYVVIESLLDDYFKVLNEIELKIDSIHFHLNKEPSSEELAALEEDKKKVYFIKKSILPLKEFTGKFEREEFPIRDDLQKYFYEIKDLCLTIIDECDLISSTIESNINLFFSVQGQRMNQIMKTLTVVATIFIPLTFIAGVYGMNFINMPELTWQHGYLGVWVVFVVIFMGMLLFFRKKGYF